MATRIAPVALLAALVIAACGGTALVPTAPAGSPVSPSAPSVPSPTSSPTDPNLGDVEGIQEGAPELVVESAGPESLRVSVIDPTAKAWRIVFASRDGQDRLELILETTDVAPGIRIDSYIDGVLDGTDDLTRMPGDPTVSAGGCHRTLEVCWASFDITVPGPKGALSASFGFPHPQGLQVSITGSTADWPEEPFILGPWRDSLQYATWAS